MTLTDAQRVMAQMYRSLAARPCNCCFKWEKGVQLRIHECSRCVATAAYEELVGI